MSRPPPPPGVDAAVETPPWRGAIPDNPPGQSQIAYRIADYQGFATAMLQALPAARVVDPKAPGGVGQPLKDVHLDETPAFIPALVRSWAQLGDILTFYQERIANEGYVQTAREAASVDWLYAEVGVRRGAPPAPFDPTSPSSTVDQVVYRVQPGVAAVAAIAFTVVEAPNGPSAALIPQGSQITSHSTAGGAAQVFETSADLTAKLAWNAMPLQAPATPAAATFGEGALGLWLSGIQTGLRPGARLLILGAGAADGAPAWAWRTLATVEPNRALAATLVTFAAGGASANLPLFAPQVIAFGRTAPLFGHDAIPFGQQPLSVQLAHPELLSGGVQRMRISDYVFEAGGLNAGYPQAAIRDAALDGQGVPFLATSNGVLAWNGEAWSAAVDGLTTRDAFRLWPGPEGFLFLGAGGGGVFRTTGPSAGWDALTSGVYIPTDSRSPVKASLPRSPVRSLSADFGAAAKPPANIVAVALADQGLYANNGAGWWPIALTWPTPPSTSPRLGPIAQLGATVVFTASSGVFALFIPDQPPPGPKSLIPYGLIQPGGGEPSLVAIHGEAGGWCEVMVAVDGPQKLQVVWTVALASAEPGTTTGFQTKAAPPDAEDISFVSATNGLPGVETGRMLALCAGPGALSIDTGVPHFFGVWTDGRPGGVTGLYVFVIDQTLQVFIWWPLLPLTGGPLALPPAYRVATDADTLLLVSPPVPAADWPDFRPGDSTVDLDASGFAVDSGSWLVLEQPADGGGAAVNAWPVASTVAGRRSDFALQDKVLSVGVTGAGLAPDRPLNGFDLRAATAYLASRSLPIAPPTAPGGQPAQGGTLTLAGLIDAVPAGRPLAVSGQRLRAQAAQMGGLKVPAEPFQLGQATLLADTDVQALALNRDGRRLVVGSSEPGALLLARESAGWRLAPPAAGDPPAPLVALEAIAGAVVGLAGADVYRLEDAADVWVAAGLTRAPQALALDVHQTLWLVDAGGDLLTSRDGAVWTPFDGPTAPPGVQALCVTADGEAFVVASAGVSRLPPGGDTWLAAGEGLGELPITALAAQPGGPPLLGVDGAGVYAWNGAAWSAAFADLPVQRIQSLRCAPDGAVMVGACGGDAYVAEADGWRRIPMGYSNVVSSFAATPAGPFVGRRRLAVLAAPAPEPPVVLAYQALGMAADPDGDLAAALAQGLLTGAVRRALQEADVDLSATAAVVAQTADSWVLASGADRVLIGRRAGGLTLGLAPDSLVVIGALATDGPTAFQLADGRVVTAEPLTGDLLWQPAQASDPTVAELAVAAACAPTPDRQGTVLTLAAPLANVYDPATVRVSANLAQATQGQTVRQVLGSGDASSALQQFKLSQPPLTFVPAPPPANAQSTLTVYVDGAAWREVDSLRGAAPDDRVYTLDLTSDGGGVVTFGDGVHGARLPTGSGNITAVYRSGLGPVGDDGAGVLSILLQPPAGIAKATNPVPITPGRPPEAIPTVLQRAPGRLRAAGRLITRNDFAGFIGGCAGVAQAATWELDAGGTKLLQITVAGAGATPLAAADPLIADLRAQIAARSAIPAPPVDLQAAAVLTFDLSATLWLDGAAPAAQVLAAAGSAVAAAFGADVRALAQPVYAAEVSQVLQATPGVAGVGLNALHLTGRTARLQERLAARPGRWSAASRTVKPAQMVVVRTGGVMLTVGAGRSAP